MDSHPHSLLSACCRRRHRDSYLPAGSHVFRRGQHSRHFLSGRERALRLPAGYRKTRSFVGSTCPQIPWCDSVLPARRLADLPGFVRWSVLGAFHSQPSLTAAAPLRVPLYSAVYSRRDTSNHHPISRHLGCVSSRHMNSTNAPNYAMQLTGSVRHGLCYRPADPPAQAAPDSACS